MNATAKLTLSYVAPGPNNQVATFNAAIVYVGSSSGFLDIPEAAADGTSYSVPFGTVGAPKSIMLQNNTIQALEVAVNGSEDVFTLGAGAIFAVAGPAASGITSLAVLTTALTTADGSVAYVVLGDDATP